MEDLIPENDEQRARNLMKEGKYKEAVDLFSSILEKKVPQFGEKSLECASTYFEYGKCLLTLVQSEIDVLGGILKKNMKKKLEGDDGSSSDEELETNMLDTAELMETAWEVLELARVIFTTSPDHKLPLADVFLTIGDLSMESENMQEAIKDYTQCLELRQSILPPDDRKIAETHFSIGLANEYTGNHREAVGHYTMAFKIFDTKYRASSNAEDQADLKVIVEELSAKLEELSKGDQLVIDKSTQSHSRSLESTSIEKIDSTNTPTLPVKRKAQVISPVKENDQDKKVKC